MNREGSDRVTRMAGIHDAKRIVADAFGVSVQDMVSQRRSRDVHAARLWAVYLACETTQATFAEIGKAFGNRDETIVRMYARARARQVATDESAARLFDELKARALG